MVQTLHQEQLFHRDLTYFNIENSIKNAVSSILFSSIFDLFILNRNDLFLRIITFEEETVLWLQP